MAVSVHTLRTTSQAAVACHFGCESKGLLQEVNVHLTSTPHSPFAQVAQFQGAEGLMSSGGSALTIFMVSRLTVTTRWKSSNG